MSCYLSVRFCPETIFRQTLWVIAVLVSANLFAAFLCIEMGHGRLLGLADLVHLDQERNLPTLFSSVQLLAAGSLAWFLSHWEREVLLRWLWRLLGAGLCFMALDEAVSIHELGNEVDLGAWGGLPSLQSAWVVPGLAVVTLFGVVLWRLLRALPRRTAVMFIISGGVFVAGAIGMEMLGVRYFKPRGYEDWTYTMWYTLEETLEMLGPALFIRTALRYAITKQDEAAGGAGADSVGH